MGEIPEAAWDLAQKNIDENYLMRWLSKKYNLPRTDPRLQAYTPEQALIEHLEDRLEDPKTSFGPDGKPIRKIRYKGVEIFKTGDPVFDAFEREWADQDLDALDEVVRMQEEREAAAREVYEDLTSDGDVLERLSRRERDDNARR